MSEPVYLRLLRERARSGRGPTRRDPAAPSSDPRLELRAAPAPDTTVEDLILGVFGEATFERLLRRPEAPWRVRFGRWVARGASRRRDWVLFALALEVAGLDPEEAERRAFIALEYAA